MRLVILASWMPWIIGCAATVVSVDATGDAPRADAPEAALVDAADVVVAVDRPCPSGTCRYGGLPECRAPGGPQSGCCRCGDDGTCTGKCICASPDTPIATPDGDRPIASIAPGDRVYTIDRGRRAAVLVLRVIRTPVTRHVVVRVVLRGGVTLNISAGHPTADGRTLGALRAGDWLGGRLVEDASVIAYPYDATYDILPAGDTGTYFAGGALIGSTLAEVTASVAAREGVCAAPARFGAIGAAASAR